MSEPSESFRYAYSAKQQAEVRQIQDKYRPREESKLDRLRRRMLVWAERIADARMVRNLKALVTE